MKVIGKGISGWVETRKTDTGHTYVVKTYHSKEPYESKKDYRKRVLYEYNMLSALEHRNIIQTYGYRVSDNGLRVEIFLAMGTMSLGKLITKAGSNIEMPELLCVWKQVCSGIEFMHRLNICHRDIKPENLVLDPHTGVVKIIDLATAIAVGPSGEVYGLVGSEAYAAPETYKYLKYNGKAADIWSLGILLYTLITCTVPWKYAKPDDKRYLAYMEQFNSGKGVNIPTNDSVTSSTITDLSLHLSGSESIFSQCQLPSEAITLTSRLVHIDPGLRPGIEDFNSNIWYSAIDYSTESTICSHKHTLPQHL